MKNLGETAENPTDIVSKEYVDDMIDIRFEEAKDYTKNKSNEVLKKVEDMSKDVSIILEKINKKIAGEGGG